MNSNESLMSYLCLRSLLILFNIAFWLSGLSLIWIGVWLQTDFENYLIISANYSEQVYGILIVMGATIIFVTSLACSCIVKIQSMLVINGGILITMLFSLLSLSIYIYTYKNQLINGITDGISNEINNYNFSNSTNNDNLLDTVQKNLQCCGNQSFIDWPQDAMPKSCFKNLKLYNSVPNITNIYETGCAYKLKNVINKNFTAIGLTISIIALFPFFGAVLSFGLSLMCNKGGYERIV
uniref:Tetraspanin n=1 Tax=Glossina palpalis gambiensis TaxID=67801 RepID=A0A1B0C2G3_9MUSC